MFLARPVAIVLLCVSPVFADPSGDTVERRMRRALSGEGIVERVLLVRDSTFGNAKHERIVRVELTGLVDEAAGERLFRLRRKVGEVVRRFVDRPDVLVVLERRGKVIATFAPGAEGEAGE